MQIGVRAPDLTMGARNTPFLKSSDIRCSSFGRFDDRGEGEAESERLVIVNKVKVKPPSLRNCVLDADHSIQLTMPDFSKERYGCLALSSEINNNAAIFHYKCVCRHHEITGSNSISISKPRT